MDYETDGPRGNSGSAPASEHPLSDILRQTAEASAWGVGAAPPADEPFAEPQHLCDGLAMLVAIVDNDGVDGESDVLHREVKIGLTFEAAPPIRPELVDAAHLAGRLAEASDDVWGREDHVVRVVGQDAIEVV